MLASAVLLAVALPAHAGGSADALRDMLAAEAVAPQIAVVCAPSGAALSGVAGLLGLAGPRVARSLSDPTSAILSLRDPDAARAAGLNPDGVLAGGMGPDKSGAWASLSFDGTPDQAEALLRLLKQDPKPSEGRWVLGTGQEVASLSGGFLRIQRGDMSPGSVAPDLVLLQDLPTGPACTVWGSVPQDKLPAAMQGGGSNQVVLQVPLAKGGELLMRTRLKDPAPDSLSRPTGAPAGGSTSEAPSVVMAFGASPFDVLSEPAVALRAKIQPAQLKRAERTFNLAPGATFAIFGDPSPKNVDFVLVLPVRAPPGAMNRAKRLDRRTVKLLKALDLKVDRTSPTTFSVIVGGKTLYGATRAGRVVVGARPDRVTEVVNNVGRSWLEGADLDRLQNWTLAIWTGPGMSVDPKMANVAVDLGLRSHDGAWELGLKVHGEPEGGWPTFFAAMAQGIGGLRD